MFDIGPELKAPQRHLILGGSGFIGRAVAERLVQLEQAVVIADRVAPNAALQNVAFRSFDLGSADWDSLVAEGDIVHHYAWTSIPASANHDPAADLLQNVHPTLALLDAMRRRGAKRIIFASSGGTVYGRLLRVPVPESHPLHPITAYGAGKATVELYLGQYRALHGLDCRIARLANPFGPGQNVARGQGAASAFLHKARNGEPIEIWGDGEVTRDYVHISDLAAGLVALSMAALGDAFTFNIGSGKGTSLNGIIDEIEHRLDRRLIVHRGPGRSFDVPISILDVTLARTVLGWTPKLSFGDGIAQTLAALRS